MKVKMVSIVVYTLETYARNLDKSSRVLDIRGGIKTWLSVQKTFL